MEFLPEQYRPILRKYWLPMGLAVFGLIFLAYGLISFAGSTGNDQEVVFSSEEDKKDENKIAVDVAGEVMKPGVYSLPQDSRIKDALSAAGGISADADRVWIAKNLNLAARLTDSFKLYIPRVGEPAQPRFNRGQVSGAQNSITGLINVNSASAKELDTLPGIGPVTAEKIINGRPYASIDELLSKKVVSSKVFADIKDKVSVY